MKTSKAGVDLIKSFESCRLTAYKDPCGIWTIGYGHTSGVKAGMVITQQQAEAYLVSDLAKFEKSVSKYEKYNFTQSEFDALVSFCYNVGNIDGLTAKGTRTRAEIMVKMLCYNKGNGKVLAGLTRRRKAELNLFGKYNSTKFVKDIQMSVGSTPLTGKASNALLAKTVTLSKKINPKHNSVWAVQTYLNEMGYDCGTVDGDFGSKTEAGVKKFQSTFYKTPDGEITAKATTWKKILKL